MSRLKLAVAVNLVVLLLGALLLGACGKQAATTKATTQATTTTQKTATTQQATAQSTTTTSTTTAVPKPTTTTLKPLPSIIALGATASGSTGQTGLAVADALSKQIGIKVAVQTFGNKIDEMLALKTGTTLLHMSSTNSTREPVMGLGDYSKPEWGPQTLRTITVGKASWWGFYTSKKTGIKSFDDVKGKRVTFFPGDSVRTNTMEAVFKAHGFTWNDVKKVSFDSLDGAQQALIDGTVDVAFAGLPNAKLVEVDASVGAAVIPFSQSAEMARIFRSLLPHELVMTQKGAFTGVNEEMLLPASVDAVISYDSLEADWAYQIAKGIYEANDNIIKVPATATWFKKSAANIPTIAPFHPGAIRFFKEVGLWTAEHDKWQAEALQAEKDRLASWKAK